MEGYTHGRSIYTKEHTGEYIHKRIHIQRNIHTGDVNTEEWTYERGIHTKGHTGQYMYKEIYIQWDIHIEGCTWENIHINTF